MDDARQTLLRLSEARGESLAELSRMIRRNAAYLQQYVHRGTPRRLAEEDRGSLARHFGIDEATLGGPTIHAAEIVDVPYLSVLASAGPGRSGADESLIRVEPFAPSLLRQAGIVPAMASLIAVTGDSMAPGILAGDRLVVDRGDVRLTDGAIHVLRREDALSVKRLLRDGAGVRMVSDNPEYPVVRAGLDEIVVVGRVKLLLRRPV